MKILKQLGIILIFCVIGDLLSYLLGRVIPTLTIPGTIIGMIIMIIVLFTKKMNVENVEEVGTFFTENMSFFFVPAAVSVMEYFDLLTPILFELLVIVVAGAFFTYTVTLLSVKLTINIQNKYRKRKVEQK